MSRDITAAPPLARLIPLFPQLEIEGLVGVSEMSAVFQARQKALDRKVALKILPEFIAEDGKLVDAFIADARTMARLQHPQLARVFDFGESDGLLWVIQEWTAGQTLREILANGAMSPDRAAKLLAGICRGLGYAHENQVIHGDLRAAHLIVDDGDQVKVTNFGLGRLKLAEADVRTPGVVAPELLDPDLDVDHRADIFALGVLFYEMLVGERPVGEVELPSIARPGVIGPEFDVIVAGCLHPEPAKRFQNCTDLRKALEELARVPVTRTTAQPTIRPVPGLSVATSPRKPPASNSSQQAQHSRLPLILGLLAAIAIAGWFLNSHHSNIDPIQADSDRKIEEEPDKIAANVPSTEDTGGAKPAEARGETPQPGTSQLSPGDARPPASIGNPADDPMIDDGRLSGAVADHGPNTSSDKPAANDLAAAGKPEMKVELPPVSPELEAMIPKIPELGQLRAQLQKNAAGTVVGIENKLAALRESYTRSCAEKQAAAAGREMDFWEDQRTSLSFFGRPTFELPQPPPGGATTILDGWKRDCSRETAPLARFRSIYLGQLTKILDTYSRSGNQLAVAVIKLERTTVMDQDYFLSLCSTRPDRCGLLLPGNVAHRSLGAVGSGTSNPDRINDGIDNMCGGRIRTPIRLELGGLLRIARIHFVLNSNGPNHHFRYLVRVSPDGEHWEVVCDRSQSGEWKSEQDVQFAPRPIRFIELVGTFNSWQNGLFSIRELDAYCTTEGK